MGETTIRALRGSSSSSETEERIESLPSPSNLTCYNAWMTGTGLVMMAGRFLGAFIFIKTLQQAAPVLKLDDATAHALGITFSVCYGLINLGQGSEIVLPIKNQVRWDRYYCGTTAMKTAKLLSLVPMISTQVLTAIGASVGSRDFLKSYNVNDTVATGIGLFALFSTAKLWSYYFPYCFKMVERLILYISYCGRLENVPETVKATYYLTEASRANKVFLTAYQENGWRTAGAVLLGVSGILNALSYAATLSVGYKAQLQEPADGLTAWGTMLTATLSTVLAFRYMKLYTIFENRIAGLTACFFLTGCAAAISFTSTSYFIPNNAIWPLVGIGALFTFLAYLTRTARLYDAFNPNYNPARASDHKHHWNKSIDLLTRHGWKSAALWPFALPILGYAVVGGYFILTGGFNNLWTTFSPNTQTLPTSYNTTTPLFNATTNITTASSPAVTLAQIATTTALAALTLIPFALNNIFIGGLSLLNFGEHVIENCSAFLKHWRKTSRPGAAEAAGTASLLPQPAP